MAERILFLILGLFIYVLPVAAGEESYGPTDEEKRLLPPYCGGPGGGDWDAILGKEKIWNNHTCYGINRINRYYKYRRAKEKNLQLETALHDFGYSIDHLSPGFKLMPEIYYYRGVVYKLLGRNAEAMSDFLKSINLDPKYVRSIAELADLYGGKMGNKEKALEFVTEGLRHSPDSKPLKRRYAKYGGKMPIPEPYTPPVAQGDSVKSENKANDQGDTSRSSAAETRSGSAVSHTNTPEAVPASVQPNGVNANQPAPAPNQRKIGSPSDPWCRFCPDTGQAQGPETSTPSTEPKAAR